MICFAEYILKALSEKFDIGNELGMILGFNVYALEYLLLTWFNIDELLVVQFKGLELFKKKGALFQEEC